MHAETALTNIHYTINEFDTVINTEGGLSPGVQERVALTWGRFLKGGINYTRYNSYSRDKSAILGITIPGIKMGSWKHYLSLE